MKGAARADEYVRNPRNSPPANVVPPSASTWYGAAGSNWNSDTNTVKVYAHITKKRVVKSGDEEDTPRTYFTMGVMTIFRNDASV